MWNHDDRDERFSVLDMFRHVSLRPLCRNVLQRVGLSCMFGVYVWQYAFDTNGSSFCLSFCDVFDHASQHMSQIYNGAH